MNDPITHILIGVGKTEGRFIIAAAPNEAACHFKMMLETSFEGVEYYEIAEVKRVFKPQLKPIEIDINTKQPIKS